MTSATSSDPSPPSGRLGLILAFVLVALPVALYCGAYVQARLSHRLVHYGYGVIGRPNLTHGIGWSIDEMVFAPLTMTESAVRRRSGFVAFVP